MQNVCSIKLEHSRDEAAIRDYKKSKELDHNDDNYYNQAMCLLYLGRYEEAINNLNKAIELNPNAASRYYHKGPCLYKLGRLEESRIALEKAVKLRPYYGIANHNRNILICKIGKQYRARVALSTNYKKRVFQFFYLQILRGRMRGQQAPSIRDKSNNKKE